MSGVLLQALISGLSVGSAYALVALGFSITFTTTRTLSFAHGDFVSAGAFGGAAALMLGLGMPLSAQTFELVPGSGLQLLALGAAVLLTALLGWLIFVAGVRPFASRPGMSWVMSTLGFGVLVQAAALAIWGPRPIAVPSPLGDDVIRILGAGVRPQELLMLAVATTVMVIFGWMMNRTIVGKVMRAVAFNSVASSLMGIDVRKVMIGAYLASSILAGLSGFLLAPIAQASIAMGITVGLKGFSGAIIGGLSSPRGCALGGLLLGVCESFVNLWQAQWRDVFVFGLVILVLAIKPAGLFGRLLPEKV